ncbi:MAG: P1 family peptidase [Congregibacter sp.]
MTRHKPIAIAIAIAIAVVVLLLTPFLGISAVHAEERPRAREAGLVIGIFSPGPLNAITDVAGVRVGQTTKIEGEDIRTGVTAIIPAPGDLFREPVPAALHVGNGYGKMIGATQIRELGEIETPILLTCTLCVWSAANALKEWVYEQPGMVQQTVNPVVGETNDARVNNMWTDPIQREEVFAALAAASVGPVAEGSVGAGTGTQAFGWKGGIGTSSRVLPRALGGWTIGVLVQTNYGGVLQINGAPVGRELGTYPYSAVLEGDSEDSSQGRSPGNSADGSIMIVVATDAPLTSRNLGRVGTRAIMGLGRTGAYASNGSGDYVLAFSTNPKVRMPRESRDPITIDLLGNAAMSPLFAATVEATEEAIYNAIFKATTVRSSRGTLKAIPLDQLISILEKHAVLDWNRSLPPANP